MFPLSMTMELSMFYLIPPPPILSFPLGRKSAKIRRNTKQMIRNDQLVEKHVQCKMTQRPCKSPKGRPAGHVLLKGEPLTALVRV